MNPQSPQAAHTQNDPVAPSVSPAMSHNIPEAFQEMTQQAQQTQAVSQQAATTPLSASDGDVIEKAWVEKVEKIIDQTKYDPHAQQEASEKLNQEYLHQRFGIDVRNSQAER